MSKMQGKGPAAGLAPEKADAASLANDPSVLCCGASLILAWGLCGGDAKRNTARVLAILRVLKETLGDLVVAYSLYHWHITIGAIHRTTYKKPGRRLDTLDQDGQTINVPEMLAAVAESSTFTIELDRLKVNKKGEILLLGRASKDGSEETVTELRDGLMEGAGLPIQEWDRGCKGHSCIGYLLETPPAGQLEKAMDLVEELTGEWQADGGPIARIRAESLRAMQYSHRSTRSGPYVELPLGQESGLTEADVRSTILDDVEPIFLDLDGCVRNWLSKKMAIWRRLNPDGNVVARRKALVAMARRVLGQGDDFLADA